MEIFDYETLTKVNDGISLIQNPSGLTFGTDALLLAAFIKRSKFATAAEFGSGSGIVSLLCARREKFAHIYAVEIQPEYASITRRNIGLNRLDDKIEAVCCDLREFNKEVDAVFTNPPYMKTTSGFRNACDLKYIARHEVCGDIAQFCASAARILKFGGDFYCVYRPDRMIDLVCAMREAKIEPKRLVFVYPDARHEPCLVLVEGRRGGKPSLITPKPLILYREGTTEMTDELKYIYDNGDFYE